MNDNERDRSWYEPGGEAAPESHISSAPADADPPSSQQPPHRSAGSPPSYSEPYWSEKERSEQPPAAQSKRGRHSVARAVGVCALIIVLIIASALIFSERSSPEEGGSADGGFSAALPDDIDPNDYENFRDFFENYYTETTDDAGSNTIPTVQAGAGVTIALESDGGEELSLSEIYALCIPSVVGITADVSESSYNWGTGIIFDADGYIVTNAHVLDGSESATVTLWDDSTYEAKLVAYDSISDLAVLKIEATGLTAAQFAESSDIAVGDEVVAIGNPLGEEFRGTMTNGIISAIDRNVEYNGHSMTLMQTNAAINEGNSGGPLINMRGQIIGITNMKMMSYYSSIEGIGFAIPSSTIKSVVDSLVSTGSVVRAAIGITVGAIPESASEYYDLPDGLYITKVSAGSDAEAKGVLTGDVLTAVNGTPVTTTSDVREIKDDLGVGDTITLTLYRSGEYFDVTVTLVDSNTIN